MQRRCNLTAFYSSHFEGTHDSSLGLCVCWPVQPGPLFERTTENSRSPGGELTKFTSNFEFPRSYVGLV